MPKPLSPRASGQRSKRAQFRTKVRRAAAILLAERGTEAQIALIVYLQAAGIPIAFRKADLIALRKNP